MQNIQKNSKIVLQGEIAFTSGHNTIKTPMTTHCNVVTFYNKKTQAVIFTHIDAFTCVSSTIDKINELALLQFKLKLNEFTINIIGGSEVHYSKDQKNAIIDRLSREKLTYNIIKSYGRQIQIDAENGTLSYFKNENIDSRLEFLQKYEFTKFQKILTNNCCKKLTKEENVPSFQPNIGKRDESELNFLEIDDVEIDANGNCLFTPDALNKAEKTITTEHIRIVSDYDKKKSIDNLRNLCSSSPKEITKIIEEGNFNLLFRKSATEYSRLFIFLLTNSLSLNIDINSKGLSTGKTALDVAKECNNSEAVKLLNKININNTPFNFVKDSAIYN